MTDAPNRLMLAVAFAAGAALAAAVLLTSAIIVRTAETAKAGVGLTTAELAEVRQTCSFRTFDGRRCLAIALHGCDRAWTNTDGPVQQYWLECRSYGGDWRTFINDLPD